MEKNIPENIQRYCNSCLAKKSGESIECDVQNAINCITNKTCFKIVLHVPGRKEQVMANCVCSDEARIYSEFIKNSIRVDINQIECE